MKENIRKLKEIIQSANINFLIGAGASLPFLLLLGDIEKQIEDAKGDEDKVLKQLKRYFNDIMKPCKHILDNGASVPSKSKFDITYKGYHHLFDVLNKILIRRKSTLLSKQVNIFTTNIDIFMEKVLEDMNIEYNDGFNGNVMQIFQTSNFYKLIHKISSHFGNISEIPTFNIIKLHGSLSWEIDSIKEKIIYSRLSMIDELDSLSSNEAEFKMKYDELQIVNPSKDKFRQTVMGVTHYELLRMYSGELEKENSVLFVLGFSMEDEHIREITLRVANSNPTLKIYIFCYSNGITKTNCEKWFGKMKYKNVEILTPPNGKNYDIETICDDFLEKLLENSKAGEELLKNPKEDENEF